ncbi:Cell surface-binding protein [Dirofilaria immitis]
MLRVTNSSKPINPLEDNKMTRLLMRRNATEFSQRRMLVSRYSSFIILGIVVLFIIVAYIQHVYMKYEVHIRPKREKRQKFTLKNGINMLLK